MANPPDVAEGTEVVEPAAVPVAPVDEALPLAELDRHLAPLRRTVAFALHRGDTGGVRFLEVNGTRWLRAALRLPVPDAIRDLLATMGGRLAGFDGLPEAERVSRLRAINQALSRLDAVLGLPLHAPVARPARPPRPDDDEVAGPEAEPEDEGDEGDDDADDEPSRGGRRDEGSRALRLGDPRGTGRSLADLGTAAPLVEALARQGIVTLADLLLVAPVSEEVLRPVHGAGREIPPGRAAVGGRVHARATRLRPDRTAATELLVQGAGPLRVRLPQAAPPWLLPHLAPGTRVVLVGTYVPDDHGGVLTEAEWVPEAAGHAVHLPHYAVDGVDERVLRAEIRRLLPAVAGMREPLSRAVLDASGLPTLDAALTAAHLHGSAQPAARRRVGFEELLTAFLGLGQAGGAAKAAEGRQRGIQQPILHGMVGRLALLHDLQLADPQQVALEEIKRDLRRSAPMLRLLGGEVGWGQGSVPFAAAVLVAESKSQVLCVGPDRATIEARFLFAEPLLREVGLVARLLDDDPSRAQRDALRRGEVHIAFALDSALDAGLEFRRLGLVIAEEDGRLRATSRRVAGLKPPRPDVLVVAPTPVPTEALLRAYADHAISEIRGVAQHPAKCEVLDASERMGAYERVAARVRAGEQAWVLFPMVRGNDALDFREAARLKATLESQVFQGLRIGLFHGGTSREDRQRIYEDFRHRRLDVLLATTIVEEGPAVPDASVAVIEHADKLSAERTTRIRAHVATARREATAFFILGETPDPEGVQRLRRLVAHDPFAADLPDAIEALEYPDDAAPAARFRWARPAHDRDLALAAHSFVARLLADDPGMRLPAHAEVGRSARWFWSRLFDAPVPIPEVRATAGSKRRRRRRKRK